MAVLHNRISRKELKERIKNDPTPRKTISFYRYAVIDNPSQFRDELYVLLNTLSVLGRIYVSSEGINAQVSVPEMNIEAFRSLICSLPGFDNLLLNIAVDDGKSFYVLDIKVKKKILADGITDETFSMTKKGKYIDAFQMNKMMEDPDTVVIDMRNHYEYEVGHFENAVEICSDTFREQLPMAVEMLESKKDKNIVMYCTGGIRCEKASAYMLHKGFQHVYHLEGGIINYAQQVVKNGLKSRFIGKNFVFDSRLGERITDDVIAKCHLCGKPSDTHVNCRNEGCHLLFIQCDQCKEDYEGCCSKECQEFIQLPPNQQKDLRKGKVKDGNIFNKSKSRLRPKLNRQNS